jgi:hypothetical protein
MTGYVRQDTTNNIADGNVINAADFDNEYNAIESAFNKTTGHAHDGTDAEGAPITKVGPSQDVVVSSSTVTPKTDNTIDLGTSLLQFKNIYLSGAINGTTIPSSVTLVSTAATQTLTNKTIAFASNTLTDVAGTTATQTLTNKTVVAPVVLASATTTQDGVIVTGRAGGSTSLRVTVAPTTLTASRAQTLPDAAGTFVLDTATQTLTNKTIAFSSNTLTDVAGTTATQTLTNKTVVAPVVLASTTATQDGVIVTGRAGGSTSLRVTIAPTTLTASRAQTLPDAAGTFVLDAATQTLTNKTLTSPVIGTIVNTGTLTLPTSTDTLVGRATTDTLTNKTLTAPTITGAILNDGYTEEVFAVTGTTPALSPTNGSIQTWTLTANSTPTAGTWAAGQSLTLMVDDGTAYTITWTSLAVTWKTNAGVAPTLNTTGVTAIQLWKVGSVIYGARVGNA